MTSPPKLSVLIAGAGIAGPCLAYFLTRTRLDVSIKIVERAAQPRTTGQAVDVRGPAIEVIKRMRLEPAIKACHTTEIGTVFLGTDGKPIARFMASGSSSATAEYEILRTDLSNILMKTTENLSSIEYIYNEYIQSMEQSENGVDVHFSSGKEGNFDVVVAADGSSSKTRSMILGEDLLKDCYNFLGQYIAFFSIPSEPSDEPIWYWYNSDQGRAITTRPHRAPSTTIGAYLTVTTPSSKQRDEAIEEAMAQGTDSVKALLRSRFTGVGWQENRVLEGMESSDDFYMARLAKVHLTKWTNQRSALLGDAAYFATFGIATSLAIQGAYVLAGEISTIQSTGDVSGALERYEKVCRPLVEYMDGMPNGAVQLANPQSNWALQLRNTVLWAAGKMRVHKLFGGPDEIPAKVWTLPEYDWRDF